jgi:hypothetical protein
VGSVRKETTGSIGGDPEVADRGELARPGITDNHAGLQQAAEAGHSDA